MEYLAFAHLENRFRLSARVIEDAQSAGSVLRLRGCAPGPSLRPERPHLPEPVGLRTAHGPPQAEHMKAFRELQTQRKAEERQAALEAAKPKAKAASASTTSEELGFGFSNRSGLIPTEANTQTECSGQGFGFSCVQTNPQATSETPPLNGQKAA